MTSKTTQSSTRPAGEHPANKPLASTAERRDEHPTPSPARGGAAGHGVHPELFTRRVSVGLLILRVVLGVTFLMHGWQKVSEWGLGGTAESFEGMGVPAPAASAVFAAVVELLGGLALVLGVLTRLAGILLAVDMAGTLVLVHASEGFFAADGGIELVLLLGAAALTFAFTGPGRFAVARALPGGTTGSILA